MNELCLLDPRGGPALAFFDLGFVTLVKGPLLDAFALEQAGAGRWRRG